MSEKKTGLKIYQSVVIFAAAVLIAAVPSLMVWKYHIMSVTDPAVVIGLVVCYLFAICAIGFSGRYLWKTVTQDSKANVSNDRRWQGNITDDCHSKQTV